ncbi:MAG: DUF3631 domain-containing protein [Planctomycetes bacterium]|nr:DUF3631 domain-containing protein [Planctomycetota bacterium]
MVLPEPAATVTSAWAVGTHVYDQFDIFPRLGILSPERGCGKSTLLALLAALVRRPLEGASMSAAVLYRLVEAHRPTLLLDELDATFKGDPERAEAIRGTLNAGHRADGRAWRCKGKTLEPESFSCYAPAALAAIRAMPETLVDRSLVIVLHRAAHGEFPARLRRAELGSLKVLGRKAARWAADNATSVAKAYANGFDMPEALGARETDNLEPLLAVATVAGGDWPRRVLDAALAIRQPIEVEAEGDSVELLRDVADIAEKWGGRGVPTVELLAALVALEDRPWATWNRGRELTASQVSKKLKPFGIKPQQWWEASSTTRGYDRGRIRLAAARYVSAPQPVCGMEKSTETGLKGQNSIPHTGQTPKAEHFLEHERRCGPRDQIANPDGTYSCGRCRAPLDLSQPGRNGKVGSRA